MGEQVRFDNGGGSSSPSVDVPDSAERGPGDRARGQDDEPDPPDDDDESSSDRPDVDVPQGPGRRARSGRSREPDEDDDQGSDERPDMRSPSVDERESVTGGLDRRGAPEPDFDIDERDIDSAIEGADSVDDARSALAGVFSDQTGADIEADDFRVDDDQIELRSDAQRQVAAAAAGDELGGRVPVDALEETDDGFAVSAEFQQERVDALTDDSLGQPAGDLQPTVDRMQDFQADVETRERADRIEAFRQRAGLFEQDLREERLPDVDTDDLPSEPATAATRRETVAEVDEGAGVQSVRDVFGGVGGAVGALRDEASELTGPAVDGAAAVESRLIPDSARQGVFDAVRDDPPRSVVRFREDVAEPVGGAVVSGSDRVREGARDVTPDAEEFGTPERVAGVDAPFSSQRRELAEGAGRTVDLGVGVVTGGSVVRGISETEDATRTVFGNIEEDGIARGTETTVGQGLTAATMAGGALADEAVENPFRLTGELGAGLVGGTAAARAAERGTAAARLRVEGRSGPDIDAAPTITPSQRQQVLEQGDQPTFETDTTAPGPVARQEFEERAIDQPDELQDALGSEQVTLRSESARLPGDLEAQEGAFELPGLFTSADFPALRADLGGRSGGVDVRLPRLFAEPQRASAFETPDIQAMPERAGGSGFALRDTETGDVVETGVPQAQAARRADETDTLERIPDPEEPGVRFLQDDAEPGAAFVRPGTDRTPEFEAIFPPGTEFERVGTGTIGLGGDRGTLDLFRLSDEQRPEGAAAARQDVDADADVVGETAPQSGVMAGGRPRERETFTTQEVSERLSSGGRELPESQPVTPAPPTSPGLPGGGGMPAQTPPATTGDTLPDTTTTPPATTSEPATSAFDDPAGTFGGFEARTTTAARAPDEREPTSPAPTEPDGTTGAPPATDAPTSAPFGGPVTGPPATSPPREASAASPSAGPPGSGAGGPSGGVPPAESPTSPFGTPPQRQGRPVTPRFRGRDRRDDERGVGDGERGPETDPFTNPIADVFDDGLFADHGGLF